MKTPKAYYQTGSIASLLSGVYDGDTEVRDLYAYGDFGLGTTDRVDGEVVIDQGKFYVCGEGGKARLLNDDEVTPFSVVTFFEAEKSFSVDKVSSMDELSTLIDKELTSCNQMAAVRVCGLFSYIKARTECAQPKPYRPLSETLPGLQTIFEWQHMAGVMVATYFPPYMDSINASPYHYHFISEDKQLGGHVFDFASDQPLVVEICQVKRLIVDSIDNDCFNSTKIDPVMPQANDAVEKN
ncbi:MAG: acetolactate decarboxylase [Coxiellaceae bacterium]|nr:acetolactate decarboxylase [Coxiellaceae bacterium]